MRDSRAIGWVLACGLMMMACASPRPASQVIVLIDAEAFTRGESTRLVVDVRGGHAGEDLLDAFHRDERIDESAWPVDVTIVPAGGDPTRLFEVEATAYDAGGRVVSQARIRAGYAGGESRTVRLVLEDACRGVICPEETACRDGRCEPIMPTDRDAGTAVLDADAGPPPPCTTDAQCDDGNACNGFERCGAGVCSMGARLDCDDHVACTMDSCDGRQCVHTGSDATCIGGPGGRCDPVNDCQYDACTPTTCVSSGCQSATCVGATCMRTFACATGETCCGTACVPTGCLDTEDCTTDYCDDASSACRHDARTGPCDDHDACTATDACASGRCVGSGAPVCADTNACTADACDQILGCTHYPNAVSCDDGDGCTSGDLCGGGTCVPGPRMACDDGVVCTVDACGATGCTHVATDSLCGGAMRCDAITGCQPIGTCNATNCTPTAGACETAACSADLIMCVRTPSCAGGQMCCGGGCVAPGCDDGNPCTDDACAGGGCSNTYNTRGCSDGDPCTVGDACSGGSCAGTPANCDDGNDCSIDACGSDGGCTYVPAPGGSSCEDGSGCTTEDRCIGFLCMGTFCRPPQPECCFDLCISSGGPACTL